MRPILTSVLVLALARGVALAGLDDGDGYCSPYNYASSASLVITNYHGAAQANFPIYLKISEARIPGFRFADVKNGTDDIVFFDSTGRVLEYELEDGEWNTAGETHLWMRVPAFRNGEKITMAWNLRDGCTAPKPVEPKRIWSDYVGVWHMDEEIDDTAAKEERPPSSDATGNGRNLEPRVGPEGVYYTMTSADGVFGRSRTNDTSARNKKQGSYFEMANSADLALNGVFTMSFWIKFDAYANYPQLMTRRTGASDRTGFQVDMSYSDRKKIIARGTTQTGEYRQVVDTEFKKMGFVHLAFVYNGPKVSIYSDGVLRVDEMTIGAASDNGAPITIGNIGGGTDQSVWGEYDEIRLYKGIKSADWIVAEHAIATNNSYVVYGAVTNDVQAVLKNGWTVEPSVTKTTWDADDPTDRPTLADFNLGTPAHGTPTIAFYDKTTGAALGSIVPKAPGEYRAVITVDVSRSEGVAWGALEKTIDFRIVSNRGHHDLGANETRVLLMNDDYSVEGGEVEYQAYDDEEWLGMSRFWRHLDEDGQDASTTFDEEWSVSPYFNLGGGTHHQYFSVDGIVTNRLWDLRGVRVGNTFNNGDTVGPEKDDEGLQSDQNYLPWNRESQRSPDGSGYAVGPYHRYASHVTMQNVLDAAVASSLYTNGIGTIYFDAVNGWTDNVRGADGAASYELVVEVATNALNSSLPPTDARISSNPEMGNLAYDPFRYADWRRVPVRVLRFNGEVCTDLGMSDSAVLDITDGGSYTNFYRIIAPVGVRGNARFRIRRVAIDRGQAYSPDGYAYILMDNVICSTPPDSVQLEPFGRHDAAKKGHEVQGWGGAFDPAFPVAGDVVWGRAKATMANGGDVPAGTVSSATMHYRWHYIDQKATDWQLADLDPATLVSRRPLALPPYEGDIEFWYDLTQVGSYYEYADYSGTGLKLEGSGYSEAITSVTNRAPNAAVQDWFVRLREGTSHYAEMKLLVKTSRDAEPQEVGLWVSGDNMWRGYYRMTEALADGFWWRIEPRDIQTDGAADWNLSTNHWYVMDWTERLPTFPATGRMSEGTTESWSRMTCDKQTGYLMFQVDERTLGITVLHADYQNFNDWSAPNEYFSCSSAESGVMQGTSAEIKTYAENYAEWTDEHASDEWWKLDFTAKIGDPGYPGYKTFLTPDVELGAWNLGMGMWIYGKYREPESKVAYQAAGSGLGYATFSPQGAVTGGRWPRGLGSVSFKARLAQTIDPDMMSYNYVGRWMTEMPYFLPSALMTNYTFMVRGCFDRKQNQGFAGNAALSLFAYYTPRVGTYEARWEQIQGEQTKNDAYKTEYLGPRKSGQRLVISRWDAVGSTYQETVLHAVTNNGTWNISMPLTPYESTTATNNLLPFCISVFEEGNATIVAAAVRRTSTGGGGVSWNQEMSTMSASWYFAVAVDKSNKRLKRGAYGVLTSNSEGMMLAPQFRNAITHPSDITPEELAKISGGTGTYPAGDEKQTPAGKQLNGVTGFTACYDELANGCWSVNPGRQKAFYGLSERQSHGFEYVAEPQTVAIQTRPLDDSEDWQSRETVTIDDFGTPYDQPDVQRDVHYNADCKVRLTTGGDLDGYRKDVALSDIELTQWRGRDNWATGEDDWNFHATPEAAKTANNFGYTNIVFTSGWVTNKAVRLSAKRTVPGYACSVRSPVFDGQYQAGYGYHSVGLGLIGIRYRRPTENISLKVQVATNYADTVVNMSRSVAEGPESWITLTNLTYDVLTDREHWDDGRDEGAWTLRLGWHGVKGMMRIVIDDALTRAVAGETDPSKFGEIDILEVVCKDEPALDKGCWWGWNLKTVGDATDSARRMYLADYAPYLQYIGQSMALNNSLTDGVNPKEDTADVAKHLPFVQSPSFTNALIGQISFKARKYDVSERAPGTKVVVYGAKDKPDLIPGDDGWEKLEEFDVTNTVYESFTCKTQNTKYYALRLVTLIGGTSNAPPETVGVKNPQRVLLDEVVISEAVSAMLSFRNVGAFRTGLETVGYVEGVTTSKQQPLCDEDWGIQAEVFATMLEDEICLERKPNVTLHWFEGTEPWGYANWKDRATGHAALAEAEGTNYVYRSSYDRARAAVMPPQSESGKVVQYMLEVEYWTVHLDKSGVKTILPATNWLDSVAWSTPEWFAPLDYNADPQYGAGRTFAGYTILDKVAPGWAWINEVNLFGTYTRSFRNTDEGFQYVEVCVPVEADLSGWRLRMLDASDTSDIVITNDIAFFGSGGVPGKKELSRGLASNKVFRCVGNAVSERMKKSNGTLDGKWTFDAEAVARSTIFERGSEYDYVNEMEIPFGVQLLRPSGIIESSVVVVGTNGWADTIPEYMPSNVVAKLNRLVPGSRFFYACADEKGEGRSDSVTDSRGESAEHWTNDWLNSPGYINTNGTGQVQQIDPNHPQSKGNTVIIYARVDRSGGPICQSVGGSATATNDFELIVLTKGSEKGTNIVYTVDPWYEVAGVTTNGAPAWVAGARTKTRELTFWVGKGASNTIDVVASAREDRDLAGRYGLTDDNPYKRAVLDWLHGGRILKGDGRDFDLNGTICLADLVGMDGKTVLTNMTLTAMYWLDMDPTVSNQILKAGMLEVRPWERQWRGVSVTNERCRIVMMISNRLDGAYSPYVLRGLEPGSLSWNYQPDDVSTAWTSETFKVTGFLNNGQVSRKSRAAWQPLRTFVIQRDSFYQPGNPEGEEPFTTKVEIVDPHTEFSTGAKEAGWVDWCREHGYTYIWPYFSIDTRVRPTAPEVLKPDSNYND